MKKFFGIIILIFVFISLVYSQQGISQNDYVFSDDALSRLINSSETYQGISITLDPGIQDNYFKHLLYNRKNPVLNGFRIRIFSASGHDALDQAREVRSKFLSKYDDIAAYLQYDAPDYKVYVGDCRTRSEILKLFYEIKDDFPYAFIVSQHINFNGE